MTTHAERPLRTADWGTLDYAPAFDRQRELNTRVAGRDAPPTLVMVEHPPVLTLTPRAERNAHQIASPQQLAVLGIDVQPTDRGGDITYHGPGQLVAYPVLRLGDFGLSLGRYMRLLEQIVIDTVAAYQIKAHTQAGATGVWVGAQDRKQGTEIGNRQETSRPDPHPPHPEPRTAKLCALGVRVRKNTTMHGLALNVTTDLSHFDTIVPCGLHGRAVTSMQQLLGERCPTMGRVKHTLADRFNRALAAQRAMAG